MNREVLKMQKSDRAIVIAWIIFMWALLGYVFFQGIFTLASSYLMVVVALIAVVAVGVFVTGALISLLDHLHKNGAELYAEDLLNLQRMRARR